MGGCLAVLVPLALCGPVDGLNDQGRRSPAANPVLMFIPNGTLAPRYGVITEVAVAGVTQRFRWRDKGENWPLHELAIGRGTERRSESLLNEHDFGRTTILTRPKGVGIGAEVYIASSWSAELEVTATPTGPQASLRLNYFPQEGVVIGFGLDSRGGVSAHRALYFDDDDITGVRLLFYLFARELVASAVERVPVVGTLLVGRAGAD
jgi:hypothetical protein